MSNQIHFGSLRPLKTRLTELVIELSEHGKGHLEDIPHTADEYRLQVEFGYSEPEIDGEMLTWHLRHRIALTTPEDKAVPNNRYDRLSIEVTSLFAVPASLPSQFFDVRLGQAAMSMQNQMLRSHLSFITNNFAGGDFVLPPLNAGLAHLKEIAEKLAEALLQVREAGPPEASTNSSN
ncbi:MAG: hypothetical protein KIS97_21010 [Nitrospira sp.]|nr:hypothetical protein [Nitrospira sp.]MCW5872353.1 hypothetical protein [Candidatus Eremiobacteraeota bacterium]